MQKQTDYREVASGLAAVRPRPFGLAVVELPYLYLRALFTPTARFFAEEGARASWGIVWFQLLLLIAVPGILGYLRGLDRSAAARDATNSAAVGSVLTALAVSTTTVGIIVQIIFVPILFFFGIAVQFALAKAFRGYGRMVAHSYTNLLYQVPLTIIASAVSNIFIAIHMSLPLRVLLYPVIDLILFVYGILINISSVSGVHRLSRGTSTLVVLLTYVIFAILIVALVVVLARAIITALHHS